MTLPACPRCARNWSMGRDGEPDCLLHGDYIGEVATLPAETKSGGAWTEPEEAYVYSHLQDTSFRQIAEGLRAMGYQRTQKAVEHLVYDRGWDKGYARAKPDGMAAMPKGLAPADRAVAVLIRERGLNGWSVSFGQMATATGMHRSSVRRSIQRLLSRRLIEVAQRRDEWHGHRPNSYRWVGAHTAPRVRGSNEEVQ